MFYTLFVLHFICIIHFICPTLYLTYTLFVLHFICITLYLSYTLFVLHFTCSTLYLSYTLICPTLYLYFFSDYKYTHLKSSWKLEMKTWDAKNFKKNWQWKIGLYTYIDCSLFYMFIVSRLYSILFMYSILWSYCETPGIDNSIIEHKYIFNF